LPVMVTSVELRTHVTCLGHCRGATKGDKRRARHAATDSTAEQLSFEAVLCGRGRARLDADESPNYDLGSKCVARKRAVGRPFQVILERRSLPGSTQFRTCPRADRTDAMSQVVTSVWVGIPLKRIWHCRLIRPIIGWWWIACHGARAAKSGRTQIGGDIGRRCRRLFASNAQ
jgi:hypothetical protein